MLTNNEAKLYLAEQLPEKIIIHATGDHLWREPFARAIRETEWQQIAIWVEEKIVPVDKVLERRKYVFELMKQIGISPDMGGKWSFVQDFALLHTSYTTRATAMKESGL